MDSPGSLVAFALAVLNTPTAAEKVALTRRALEAWRSGTLPVRTAAGDGKPPETPARDGRVVICSPADAPKRGKGGESPVALRWLLPETPLAGSVASRLALLHSLAHIESWAIDLSWDIIARFHAEPGLPDEFFAHWAIVAEEEASHHEALSRRLEALGSHYGALPAHDGLWESATRTAGSLAARLAVEHCVHEARGLDVLPQTIARFRAGGDEDTAALLETVILPEEVSHCAKGVAWFRALCARDDPSCSEADVAASFQAIVRAHFRGALKPPFNESARAAAGFSPEWYLPLVAQE